MLGKNDGLGWCVFTDKIRTALGMKIDVWGQDYKVVHSKDKKHKYLEVIQYTDDNKPYKKTVLSEEKNTNNKRVDFLIMEYDGKHNLFSFKKKPKVKIIDKDRRMLEQYKKEMLRSVSTHGYDILERMTDKMQFNTMQVKCDEGKALEMFRFKRSLIVDQNFMGNYLEGLEGETENRSQCIEEKGTIDKKRFKADEVVEVLRQGQVFMETFKNKDDKALENMVLMKWDCDKDRFIKIFFRVSENKTNKKGIYGVLHQALRRDRYNYMIDRKFHEEATEESVAHIVRDYVDPSGEPWPYEDFGIIHEVMAEMDSRTKKIEKAFNMDVLEESMDIFHTKVSKGTVKKTFEPEPGSKPFLHDWDPETLDSIEEEKCCALPSYKKNLENKVNIKEGMRSGEEMDAEV